MTPKPNQESNTPETDAVYPPEILDREYKSHGEAWGWGTLHKMRKTSRHLERQLAEAREENARLREALKRIRTIKNRYNGGDWDEIEEARNIAQQALTP